LAINFLADEANLEHFISLMTNRDREIYRSFGHLQFASAFADRLLVVYQPQGLNADCTHRQPRILTQVRITDFYCNQKVGAEICLEDTRTENRMVVGYIPQRLFNYDVFIHVPPYMQLRWDGHRDSRGAIKHSLSFAALIKTKNRADYYSYGNTYCLPPNKFRQLFPELEFTLPEKQ
jgi:hypothetical protein